MRRIMRGIVIAAVLGAAPGRVSAQAVLLEVGGGISVPLIETGQNLGVGPHGVLGIAVIPQSIPLSLELSTRYGRIAGSTSDTGGTAPDLRVLDATLNVLYRMKWSLRAPVRPWILAGVGLYNLKPTGAAAPANAETVRNSGLDGGAGIAVPVGGIEVWTDARFHVVFTQGAHTHLFTATLGARLALHRPATIR
jgi:hypothetical protein